MKPVPLKLDELTAGCKTPADVAALYSQLLLRVLDRGLNAEMDTHLGYARGTRRRRNEDAQGHVRRGEG